MAVVLDTAYQVIVLKAYFFMQTLIVAVACAIVPYILIRSPVGRFMRWHYQGPRAGNVPGTAPKQP
jgi:hypothetical protein